MVRHRRAVVVVAVVVLYGLVVLALLMRGVGRDLAALLVGLLAIGLVVLAAAAQFRPRQPAFVVDPRLPAFRAAGSHEGQVLFRIVVLSLSAEGVLARLSSAHEPAGGLLGRVLRVHDGGLSVLAATVVPLAAANAAPAWRGLGVELRPHGVADWYGPGHARGGSVAGRGGSGAPPSARPSHHLTLPQRRWRGGTPDPAVTRSAIGHGLTC